MPNWRPLSKRNDESYDALHEGVPTWLVGSLFEFVVGSLSVSTARGPQPNREKLQEVERKLRAPLDWTEGANSALTSIRRNVDNREYFLDLVDLLLWNLSPYLADGVAKDVERRLKEGGSTWSVNLSEDDHYRLVRRLDETVVASAKAVMSASGRAGKHLAKAWTEVYGRHPDASTAYREAVRAIEAIAIPVISPRNPTATLGTMIADMRNAPTKWTVVLSPKAGDPVAMIREAMELVWTAELDRHGTADESVPLHASSEEAEAALHLAVTLVHWFQSGAIKARP
jgi:hypothetical protein